MHQLGYLVQAYTCATCFKLASSPGFIQHNIGSDRFVVTLTFTHTVHLL